MDFNQLIRRVRNIIVTPADEWITIRNEEDDRASLIRSYALPLILVLTGASFIGKLFIASHVTLGFILSSAVVTFAGAFLSLYLSAYIVNELTPAFGSSRDSLAAFKLVVYSYTAVFIVHSVASLFPSLFFLMIFGLYSVYLLWMGVEPVMKIPADKKAPYVIVTAFVMLGVYTLLIILLGRLLTSAFVSYGMNTL